MRIRPLRRSELETAVGWAAAEGWDPGHGDADAFWAADPGGFWGGELDGELVATISLVRWSPAFGFVGFYLVRPDLRGAGHGLALWRAVVDTSGLATLGLDGVPAQEGSYERSGFALAYRSARFGGRVAGAASPRAVDVRRLPRADLVAFDAAHHAAPRPDFLGPWLAGPGRVALALADAHGTVAALGVLRRSAAGHRVGPLLAGGPADARELLLALAARADGPIALDVPLCNAAAVELARDLELEPSFETARMYRGPDPRLPIERVFGVTSFELG